MHGVTTTVPVYEVDFCDLSKALVRILHSLQSPNFGIWLVMGYAGYLVSCPQLARRILDLHLRFTRVSLYEDSFTLFKNQTHHDKK